MRNIITCFALLLAVGFSAHAQSELVARAYFKGSLIEIVARDSTARTAAVKIDGRVIKEFPLDVTGMLDALATYEALDDFYVVLRTSEGSGACAGGDLYVLKFSVDSHVDASPKLTVCLGEIPPISFGIDQRGEVEVTVAGNELRGGRWIKATSVKTSKGRSSRKL